MVPPAEVLQAGRSPRGRRPTTHTWSRALSVSLIGPFSTISGEIHSSPSQRLPRPYREWMLRARFVPFVGLLVSVAVALVATAGTAPEASSTALQSVSAKYPTNAAKIFRW